MGQQVFLSKCEKCQGNIMRHGKNTFSRCICFKNKENAIDYVIEQLTQRKLMFETWQQTDILKAHITEINHCLGVFETGKKIEEGKEKSLYAKV